MTEQVPYNYNPDFTVPLFIFGGLSGGIVGQIFSKAPEFAVFGAVIGWLIGFGIMILE